MQRVSRRLLPHSMSVCGGDSKSKSVYGLLGVGGGTTPSPGSPSPCLMCRRNFLSGVVTYPSSMSSSWAYHHLNSNSHSSELNRLSISLSSCRRLSTTAYLSRKKMDLQKEEKLPIYDYGAIHPEKKRIYVFGQAAHGGLGLENLLKPKEEHEKQMLYMRRPVRHWFGDMHTVTHVAAGHGFTLVAVKPNKQQQSGQVIFGCGYNNKSQLGYQPNERGKALGCLISFVPLPLPLDKTTKILAIAAGRGHSLISVDGKGIIALGDNSFGQCGRNIIEDEEYMGSKYICRIPRFGTSYEDDVIQMASRFDLSLCLTRGGQVYTFGCNHQGQLGRGKEVTNTCIPKPVEGDLKGERVTKVVTSGASVLAISDKGRLFGWGLNDCGQVNPSEISTIYYEPIRIKMGRRIGKIIDVAIGDMFSFIVNEYGEVFVWGNGYALGLGPKTTFVKSPTIMPPPLFGRNEFTPNVSVVKIMSSFKYAAAVNSIGDLFTWGENDNGCLGLGKLTSDYQFFPFKVALGGPVHDVALGVDHTVLMTRAGF